MLVLEKLASENNSNYHLKTQKFAFYPNKLSIEVVDQSIKLKITPKIIAKIRIAIPIRRISSNIGLPLFFDNFRFFRYWNMNIVFSSYTK